MLIEQAYEVGKKIKKIILEKGDDLNSVVYKLQNGKNDKHALCYEYLQICLKYNITNNNDFMVKMLAEESDFQYQDITYSLCLGILGENDKYISFVEAAEMWNINRTTIQKAKDNGRLSKDEWKKEGRNLYIKISAMSRLFGEREKRKFTEN